MGEVFEGERGRYEVLGALGEGGMGATFVVRAEATGERLAAKVLRMDRVDDWKAVELFEREAKVLAGLDHPRIPKVVDTFRADGGTRLGLVQTLVNGRTLQSHLDEHRSVSAGELVDWLRQGLELLAFLHGRVPPVVHRDVTPRNLLVADGQLWLVDFGAVKTALSGQATVHTAVGTFGYMPPEQIMGQAGPGADMYALGVTFVALAAGLEPGRLPLDGDSGRIDVRRAVGDATGLPGAVVDVLEAMTRPGLGQRLVDAREALARLSREPEAASPARTGKAPARRVKVRHLLGAALLCWVVGAYAAQRWPGEGEVGALGGWFSGHPRLVSAVTGALWGDYAATLGPNYVRAVAFGPDGRTLVSAATDDVLAWDVEGERVDAVVEAFEDQGGWGVQWLGFSGDGRSVVVATAEDARVVDVQGWTERARVAVRDLSGDVLSYAWRPTFLDGVAAADGGARVAWAVDATVLVVDPLAGRVVRKVPTGGQDGAALGARGERLVVWRHREWATYEAATSTVTVWDVATGLEVTRFLAPKRVQSLAMTDDGARLVVVDSAGLAVWDAQQGTPLRAIPTTPPGYDQARVALSPDGRLAATPRDGGVRVFALDSGEQVAAFGVRPRGYFVWDVDAMTFAPDGRTLATAATDQVVRLWRVPEAGAVSR